MGGIRRQHASRRSPDRQLKGCTSQANVSAKVKLASRVDATCEIGQGETVRSRSKRFVQKSKLRLRYGRSKGFSYLVVHDERRLGVSTSSSSPSLEEASLALQVKTARALETESATSFRRIWSPSGGACRATRDVRSGFVGDEGSSSWQGEEGRSVSSGAQLEKQRTGVASITSERSKIETAHELRRHVRSAEAGPGENPDPRFVTGSGNANCTGPRSPHTDIVMRRRARLKSGGQVYEAHAPTRVGEQ